MKAADYPCASYMFEAYVTKHRMLTYSYQIFEILRLQPSSVLEVGTRTGLVTSYLRWISKAFPEFIDLPNIAPKTMRPVDIPRTCR